MSNIYPSILEKLAALNIDIYHYEDIVRCYALAKLNIEHSKQPDYTDGGSNQSLVGIPVCSQRKAECLRRHQHHRNSI